MVVKLERKFNLAEVGKQYDSVTISTDEGTFQEQTETIDSLYKVYIELIRKGIIK